jgi:aryl-alcohol dehydrogenase-like predicted oxidoreductase
LNDILTSIASRHSVAIASVALSWVLQNQACDVALVGIRDCKQLSELIDASKIELTQEERIMIDQSLEVFKEMVLI